MADDIRKTLETLAEPAYARFAAGLLPGVDNLLGVRLPALRKLARRLAEGDWRACLGAAADDSFEEVLLQGFVLGYINEPPEAVLPYVAAFVPKINNWSVCDSFCSSLKLAARYPDEAWDFVLPYLTHEREFFVRFGVVMLLFYYMDDAHIHRVIPLLDRVGHEGYYARMAVAWALSVCYVRQPRAARAYLDGGGHPDLFVRRKTMQKIVESRQVSDEDRSEFRSRLRQMDR